MSDINSLMTTYYAQVHGQSQEQKLKWWNSLTDAERELIVDHCADVLSQFYEIVTPLGQVLRTLGVAIIAWYDSLDPEVKQVMQDIADGKGTDALRK